MTAPHDTPEAVEAMAGALDTLWQAEAAAMMRRLHQRAADAERLRDELKAWMDRAVPDMVNAAETIADSIAETAKLRAALTALCTLRPDLAAVLRGEACVLGHKHIPNIQETPDAR